MPKFNFSFAVLFALEIAWFLSFAVPAYAEKRESEIQEAIYIFEMKGKTSEAIKMLEEAANQGDEEDKEKAYFFLGKIQELLGNKTSANFYYNQSLNRTTEISKAYWLSEREGATSTQAENLLRTPITLKASISATFGDDPTFLLLRDGSIKKIIDDKLVNVANDLPPGIQIFHIEPQGVWFQNPSRDSLVFKSFFANRPHKSYPIPNVTHLFSQDDKTIVQNNQSITLLNNKGIKFQINEKYNGCIPEGIYPLTGEFVLNCTDNALHFISPDDGSEKKIIAQFDIIKKVFFDKGLLYLTSGNFLYGYYPKQKASPLWKISINSVENLYPFEKNIALLEASGRVSLIDKTTGYTKAYIRSDASSIYPLSKGTLGLFSSEGTITAIDTLLMPLWHFNFTKPIDRAPIKTNGNLYLDFGERKLQAISPRYYGKKILQSELMAQAAADIVERANWEELPTVLDSLFKLEPGNAEGWFFKALYLENNKGNEKEKQRAWSEAVRLSASNPQTTQLILNRYGKAIGAKFVGLLPISPKTKYPQFFSGKKNLYTIDPSADRLFSINPETGTINWSRNVGVLDNSPVIANDENTLAIASGYNLSIYDLNKESKATNIQLPGKAFETKVTDDAIYVTTWNGYLYKILKPDFKLAWSRKLFSVPFLLAANANTLFACNLEGELIALDDDAGQAKEGISQKIPGQITHLLSLDSIVAIATNSNRLYLYNPQKKEMPPLQILMEGAISSLQGVDLQNKKHILIGLSDQSILLYTESGAPLWKHQGKNAVFPKPFVKNGYAWLDQDNEVVAISLKTGKVERKFSTPGGAGTPFVMNNTLFSASPKRLLYGFGL